MADANNQLGDEFKVYLDTADDFDTPTWAEIVDFGNLGKDPAPVKVEIPKRLSHKVYKKGRLDTTITGELSYDPTNANHVELQDAIESGVKVHLAIANGPIATAGTRYTHGWFLLTGPEDYSLDGPAVISLEMSPHADADHAEQPAKVIVSS